MKELIAIAIGGASGALLRYGVSDFTYRLLGRDFPWGTLAVNVVGSLLMGILYILLLERLQMDGVWRALLLVGLLGAFTTFSTFSVETLLLLETGNTVRALLNIVTSVILCLLACWLGLLIGRSA